MSTEGAVSQDLSSTKFWAQCLKNLKTHLVSEDKQHFTPEKLKPLINFLKENTLNLVAQAKQQGAPIFISPEKSQLSSDLLITESGNIYIRLDVFLTPGKGEESPEENSEVTEEEGEEAGEQEEFQAQKKKPPMSFKEFRAGKSGPYKTIYNGYNLITGIRIAFAEEKETRRKIKEEEFLKKYSGKPGIITTWDTGTYEADDGKRVDFIIQDRCDGNMKDLPEEINTPAFKRDCIETILGAVVALHSDDALHRDFKPPNFLYKKLEDGSYGFYLIDFGVAAYLDQEKVLSHVAGTPFFFPPEIIKIRPKIRQLKYNLTQTKQGPRARNAYQLRLKKRRQELVGLDQKAIDIFYMGMSMLRMWTDEEGAFQKGIIHMKAHFDGDLETYLALKPKEESSMEHLVWEMLHPIPEERPKAEHCLERVQKL